MTDYFENRVNFRLSIRALARLTVLDFSLEAFEKIGQSFLFIFSNFQ